jgi:hypothetical protein
VEVEVEMVQKVVVRVPPEEVVVLEVIEHQLKQYQEEQ